MARTSIIGRKSLIGRGVQGPAHQGSAQMARGDFRQRGAVGQRMAIGGWPRQSIIGQRMAIGQAGPSPFAGYNPTVFNIQENAVSAARRVTLGFTELAIPAGANRTVTALPQLLFRPDRLIIGSDIAAWFTIQGLIIGNRPQQVAAGSSHGLVWAENGVGTGILCDTAEPGIQVQLLVTNISAAARDFRAALFGAAVTGAP